MTTPEPEKEEGASSSAESRDDDARKQSLHREPSFSRWCDDDQIDLASRSGSCDSSNSCTGDESDDFQLSLLQDRSRSGPPDGQRTTYFRQRPNAVDGRRYAMFNVENELHPNNPAAHAASRVFATITNDSVINPMDTVKQRLHLRRSPYIGVADYVKRVLREEGVQVFYASYRTMVVMNAPFMAVYFATYETANRGLTEVANRGLTEVSSDSMSDERLVVHATARAVAGALAIGLTTPLDICEDVR